MSKAVFLDRMLEMQETFLWRGASLHLDVTKALFIVGAPYAPADGRLLVASAINSGVLVNPRRASKADLTIPVLVATLGGWPFVVDGNHRVYRASLRKRATLPCYVLTEEETACCMLHHRIGLPDKQQYRLVRGILASLSCPVVVRYP